MEYLLNSMKKDCR